VPNIYLLFASASDKLHGETMHTPSTELSLPAAHHQAS
jgi:hypothetical protein